jgi:acetyl-CoA acetyltransferase
MWHAYQDKYASGSREQMAPFVIQSRKNAILSGEGYWFQSHKGEELTKDEYLGARMISTPLCLYDCDIPVQACGAFVLATAERARDLRNPPAYVAGAIAPYFPSQNNVIHSGHTLEWEMACGRQIGLYLTEMGFRASDVQTANLYDGFSFLFVVWLESLGFCPEGEGFSFIESGGMMSDGVPVMNTNGGNLGQGRLHGVSQVREAVLQVMRRAGTRQLANAELAVATCGFPARGSVLLFAQSLS